MVPRCPRGSARRSQTRFESPVVARAYCQGSAATVAAGSTVAAGTQVLASSDTRRSSGPHIHIQIRTPEEPA
jgi:murein DD-endopeptidase MepM/ murein hydrolase activator NlpD